MAFKQALVVLALIGAPLLNATALSNEGSYYHRDDEHTYIAILPKAIPTPNYVKSHGGENLLNHAMESADIDQSDVDASWDSLRTFKLNRMANTPIKVYIETHPSETRLYKARYVQYVKDCLDEWSTALDGRLQYQFVNSPRQAQIRVQWVAGFSIPEQAGETEYTIGDATVQIQTVDMPDNVLKGNILHELGHALGIGKHSDSNHDIMVACKEWKTYAEYKAYQPKLSDNDKQAIRRLYSNQWRKGEDLYTAVAQAKQPVRLATLNQRVNKPIKIAYNNTLGSR